jgi:uncharacterized damage-inducible protein DinB
MKTIPWIERKFEFGAPAALFPQLVERLRGTPARVEERVRDLAPDVLRRQEGGTWSIQENVGHLLDVERLWHGRLDDYDAECQVLRAADMENRRTHGANHHSHELAELLDGFRRSRMMLVERLESLDQAQVERSATHPRLGQPMRVMDLALFAAEHDDHHLARITELMGSWQPPGRKSHAHAPPDHR